MRYLLATRVGLSLQLHQRLAETDQQVVQRLGELAGVVASGAEAEQLAQGRGLQQGYVQFVEQPKGLPPRLHRVGHAELVQLFDPLLGGLEGLQCIVVSIACTVLVEGGERSEHQIGQRRIAVAARLAEPLTEHVDEGYLSVVFELAAVAMAQQFARPLGGLDAVVGTRPLAA